MYTLDLASLLTKQLIKFRSLNQHQLAGHVANLDFWSGEVSHVLAVMQGYRRRFQAMKDAQRVNASARKLEEFYVEYDPEITTAPRRPNPMPDADLEAAQHALTKAWRDFIVRCCRETLLTPDTAKTVCTNLGISLQSEDLL